METIGPKDVQEFFLSSTFLLGGCDVKMFCMSLFDEH